MTHLINNYFFIDDLPEDARNFRIYEDDMRFLYFDTKYGWEDMDMKTLEPPGHWSIVGWSDDLSDEQTNGIVESVRTGGWQSFKNYRKQEAPYFDYDDVVESFSSLLKSLGITNRVLILKKEK